MARPTIPEFTLDANGSLRARAPATGDDGARGISDASVATAAPDPSRLVPAAPDPDHAVELRAVTVPPGGVATVYATAQVRCRLRRLVTFQRRPDEPFHRRKPHRWSILSCYVADRWCPHELLYDGGFDFGVIKAGQTFRIDVRNDGPVVLELSGYVLGSQLKRKPRAVDQYAVIGSRVEGSFSAERLAELATDCASPSAGVPITAADLCRIADGADAPSCAVGAHEWAPRAVMGDNLLEACRRCGGERLHALADAPRNAFGGDGSNRPGHEHGKLDESDPDPPPACVDCGDPCAGLTAPWHAGPHCGPCAERHRGHDPDPDDETGIVTYCEHAPPRALVEATPITLDGDALGAVPRVDDLRVRSTRKWTARLQVAWDRHEAYRLTVIDPTTGQPYPGRPASLDNDPLHLAPTATDLYAGVATTIRQGHGWRCRLCGGWMRRVVVPTEIGRKIDAARARRGRP